jgi:hypothetical protein
VQGPCGRFVENFARARVGCLGNGCLASVRTRAWVTSHWFLTHGRAAQIILTVFSSSRMYSLFLPSPVNWMPCFLLAVCTAEETVMASASLSTRALFKCGPKAFRNSHRHGCLKSVVSFPVSQASDSLYSPIRVVNRAYGSDLIVTALKSRGLNTALSSTNGSLKVPGKILFAAVPVTRTKFYLLIYCIHKRGWNLLNYLSTMIPFFFLSWSWSTKDMMCLLRTTSNLMDSGIRWCDKLLENKGCLAF